MTVIYPDENFDYAIRSQRPDSSGYDLEDEKKLIAEATEEIKKELLAKWRKRYAGAEIFPSKLANINPEVVDFILAFKNTLFYDKLAADFAFNSDQREVLPQIVWETVISKDWSGVQGLIAAKLGADVQKSKNISELLFANILNEAMKLSEKPFVPRTRMAEEAEPARKTISLPLPQALKKYPQLGEQVVTSNRIQNKVFPDPVRPSIKNWINDYYENLGAEKHGSIERGNYLFHSGNTKNLTAGERQKLGTVLKSLDENSPLMIDTEKQEVVFIISNEPQVAEQNSLQGRQDTRNNNQANYKQNTNLQTQNVAGQMSGISFSSPQRMSSERQDQPQRAFPRSVASAPASAPRPVQQIRTNPQPRMEPRPPQKMVRDYLTGELRPVDEEISGQEQSSGSEKQTNPNLAQPQNASPKIKGNTVDLRG